MSDLLTASGAVPIVGNIDLAEIAWWSFVGFFIALIFYLRREDRREGYPVEDAATGIVDTPGGPLSTAEPKEFRLPHGRGSKFAPNNDRDTQTIKGERTFRSPGAPYVPTGNPFEDGLGPAAWANRDKLPDITAHGENRIVPNAMATEISVSKRDPNPVGMTVVGADGAAAGKVAEIWVDRAEHVIRYLEIAIDGGTNVLAPMPMAKVHKGRGFIEIDALKAAQFAGAPRISTPGQITRYEEERIMAYFGGGYLYADAERQEPLV
ncbi:photosynthetic reaction center subunit H [Sphingomicrobium sediminis]|uniref:Photosynthetic reaction center subunit H n=1 Tax=Sphingomicrobium sediminis TaxID=2950949 RepID=A0A9X2EFB0_9SPHN|nr:photosynthetic reaction center subunit H [Sphingomicrobium sediminis]MCM8556505.1 photosynthetic reaction center subunit H [Sphingomicrobium sediminis]